MGQSRSESPDPVAIRAALRRWYRKHHRPLPWRAAPGRLPDPYHVLVSEAMLQQTQVSTVVDYFNRFIESLPTLEDLAAAPTQKVLRLWQGLGYYRRARHLQEAARRIVHEHDGRIPAETEHLRQLPGIGRYTAGAIASIAHNRPEPLVDGNVERVLCRLWAIRQPPRRPATAKRLWKLAGELVPPHPRSHPGDFNQALMELGATVCTPRDPNCSRCPLKRHCLAHRNGAVHRCPAPNPRAAQKPMDLHILALHRNRKLLFEQRPPSGLWAHLWQMPTFESRRGIAEQMRRKFGICIGSVRLLEQFGHQTTHRKIKFQLWFAPAESGRLKASSGCWRKPGNVDDLPLARPQLKALDLLSCNSPLAGL